MAANHRPYWLCDTPEQKKVYFINEARRKREESASKPNRSKSRRDAE